jgi:protein involved in polysaccharide export with SLBB domain
MGEVIETIESGKTAALKRPSHGLSRRRVAWTAGLAGALLLTWLWLSGIIVKLTTDGGTLEVEVNQPDALVQVLDQENRVEISRPGGAGKLTITVDAGEHRLRVQKEGFRLFTRDFTIEEDGKTIIHAHLVSHARTTPVSPVALQNYKLAPGDVLGVYIEGILGSAEEPPRILRSPRDTQLPPSVGTPLFVFGNGQIRPPLVDGVQVEGLTLAEATEAIRKAYTIERTILRPDTERIMVSLVERRTPELSHTAKHYRLNPGDTVGVFIGGILGAAESVPPVHFPDDPGLPPGVGYPLLIAADGSVHIPVAGRLNVAGLTLIEAEKAVRKHLVDREILSPGGDLRIALTLFQRSEPVAADPEHARDP